MKNAQTDWTKVLFTDECSFQVGQTEGRVCVTRLPIEEFMVECLRPKFRRGPGSPMVWGAIAYDKKWPLFRFPLAGNRKVNGLRVRPETITGAKYANWITRERLGGYSDEVVIERGPTVRTVENGAAVHTAHVIILELHLANSPDLNLFENIWAVLKQGVRRWRPVPRTPDEL
ncbi:hypothetical protein CF319_g4529 [Tilletia indica]|nr:hypothetical protein CF319_g4529 [Tilletia indica]